MTPMVNHLAGVAPVGPAAVPAARVEPNQGAGSFAALLEARLDEVARMQQDASRAVEQVVAGGGDDFGTVMTAVEKADLAFKTLLAINAKFMEAYNEIKTMQL